MTFSHQFHQRPCPVFPRFSDRILRRLRMRLSDLDEVCSLHSIIYYINFFLENPGQIIEKVTTVQNTLKHHPSELFERQYLIKVHSYEFPTKREPEFELWSVAFAHVCPGFNAFVQLITMADCFQTQPTHEMHYLFKPIKIIIIVIIKQRRRDFSGRRRILQLKKINK